jgi:putative tricarboxylic transport membrane protein
VTIVPVKILAPAIIVLGVTSTYLMRSSRLDVVVAIISGIVGYFMRIYGYSAVSFLVAFILAPIAEKSFYRALMLADDSYLTFVLRPLSGIFLLTTILVIALPPILKRFRKNKESASPA